MTSHASLPLARASTRYLGLLDHPPDRRLRLVKESIELTLQAMLAPGLSFVLFVDEALDVVRLSGLSFKCYLLHPFNFICALILHQHLNFFFDIPNLLFLHFSVRFIFYLDLVAGFLIKVLGNGLAED